MELYTVKFREVETVGYHSEETALEEYQTAHRQWRWGLRDEEPEYLGLRKWEPKLEPEEVDCLEDLEEITEEDFDPDWETYEEWIGETKLGFELSRYTTYYKGELWSIKEEVENDLGGYETREVYNKAWDQK